MLTFSVIGFAVVISKFLVSGSSIKLMGYDVTFGTCDAASIGAILTPTLVVYAARRNTDRKYIDRKEAK
jgi:hypothetical protein